MSERPGQFLSDHVLTGINYYAIDAVWPVGPDVEPWTGHVRTTDVRQINVYEYIRVKK